MGGLLRPDGSYYSLDPAERAAQLREDGMVPPEPYARWPSRLARSKAELVRTAVVLVVLVCQVLAVLKLYGVT